MWFIGCLEQIAPARRSYSNRTHSFKLETRSTLKTLLPLPAGFSAVTVFAHVTICIFEINILDLQQVARLLQMNPESLRQPAFRGAIHAG